MAINLGEKMRALWKLQPWYLWAAEGLAVGTIAYIAYTNRAAASGATADSTTTPPPDPSTPPGEAPGPGSSPGASPPPQPLPPSPIQPLPPSPLQPPSAGPGGIINPGTPSGALKGLRSATAPTGTGSGGKSSLLAHAFADVHMPSEWHENHQQLGGGSNLLPFHTAGEF